MDATAHQEPPLTRPASVRVGTYLIVISLAAGLVVTLNFMWVYRAALTLNVFSGIVLFSYLPAVLVVWKLARGRNWARFVLAALVVLSLCDTPTVFAAFLDQPSLVSFLDVISRVLMVAGTALLFTSAAGAWFKAQR